MRQLTSSMSTEERELTKRRDNQSGSHNQNAKADHQGAVLQPEQLDPVARVLCEELGLLLP